MHDDDIRTAPEARRVSGRRTRPSLVWIVPIVAAIAGGWIAVTRILERGPQIEIGLLTAEGLEAGKTKIHYNGVDVGTVTAIRLSDDHRRVVATADMATDTEKLLVEDTHFWVVRPRISGANVSGLGTLISGAYIGMEIGQAKKSRRHFTGLESPPVVTGDTPGRFYTLKTSNLGSLDYGTPIYFRRLAVGEVASYQLDEDGIALSVKIFVRQPYDRYVTTDTRFWHASGIDLSLTASGLSVQTQSLLSILVGGIAFETPENTKPGTPPAADTVFSLFSDRTDAFKLPARDPQTYTLVFQQSVRGLSPGAPVEFRGIPIGEVAEIGARFDAETFKFAAPVTIHLDAERLGVKVVDLPAGSDLASIRRQVIDSLVAHGVRAQLQTGNLLTGQLYVSFDVFPDAAPATVDWSRTPVELPTMPGEFQAIEASVVNIIKKLDQVPFGEIGDDLRNTIAELDRTLKSARQAVESADNLIAPNSTLRAELGGTLQEVSRAARGIRVLADYLERHPEALLRGKPGGPE
jgi:paraquat-inducible protein B